MNTMTKSEIERITALEVQMQHLTEIVEKQNAKLDDLLGLRNKGVGAFWLASALAGTGIIGVVFSFFEWIKS